MKTFLFRTKLFVIALLATSHLAHAIRPAFVMPNFSKTWMLDIKLSQLKQENILNQNNKLTFLKTTPESLNLLPKGINWIHMYGNGLTKNFTTLLFGNTSRQELKDFIMQKISNNHKNMIVLNQRNQPSGTQIITKITYKNSPSSKENKVYIADVKNGIWVISYNFTELKRWMDYPYGYERIRNSKQNNKLLAFWLKVKPTLKNLRKEVEGENYMLQSQILQQTASLIVTIQHREEFLFFGMKLQSFNKTKVSNLFNTLSSMLSTKSNNTTLEPLKTLLSKTQIEQSGKAITLSSLIQKSAFSQVDKQ